MKFIYYLTFICTLIINTQAKSQGLKTGSVTKPNIIYILTDDLGYGDVGVFFQNQRKRNNNRSEPWALTPNLDKMADEGAILTQHYAAAPVCAPSRASILSGQSQGHANVRDNQFDKGIADNYTLGNVMQKAGYKTAAIGKWGLQGGKEVSKEEKEAKNYIEDKEWPAYPLNRGFDYYYGYIRHKDGHEHYPVEGLYDGPKEVYENRTEVSKGLDKCYTGDLFTAVAKKWIVEQTQNQKDKQPFFMYLAYDTPHAVLELPTQAYPAGGGLKGGIQWLGKPGNMINTASGTPDTWVHPDYAHSTYDNDNNPSTPEVAWPDVYKRYATSSRRIDDEVGDLLKLLADLKIDDNTLVVFSSDNGPSIESYLNEPYKANFFNSFGPFDGIKRDVLDGGTRMPLIARWPTHIPARKVINTPNISYDWLPTFTDAVGLPAPVNGDGVSLLPSLTNKGNQQEGLVYVEYFQDGNTPDYNEFSSNNRNKKRNQMQMIRMGDIVGLRYDIKNANDDFELYNIANDTHQANNLASNSNMAGMQKSMKERVLQVRMPNSSAARPYDPEEIPASDISSLKRGISWKAYQNNFPWLPNASTLQSMAQGCARFPKVNKIKKSENKVYLYEGYIRVPENGEYTFYLNTLTKAFVKIHDANVIDADYGYVGGTMKENTIKLKAGLHPVKIYYASNTQGKNVLNFEWKGPSFTKTKVPASAFFTK